MLSERTPDSIPEYVQRLLADEGLCKRPFIFPIIDIIGTSEIQGKTGAVARFLSLYCLHTLNPLSEFNVLHHAPDSKLWQNLSQAEL